MLEEIMEVTASQASVENLFVTQLYYLRGDTGKEDLHSLLAPYQTFQNRCSRDLSETGAKLFGDFTKSCDASLKNFLLDLLTLVLLKSKKRDLPTAVCLLLICISSTFVVEVWQADIICTYARSTERGTKPSAREYSFVDTLLQCLGFLAGEASTVKQLEKVAQLIWGNTFQREQTY